MAEQNCGTCLHRAYGDQRLISQCALKVFGDPARKLELRFNGRFPAPRARNFGRKCRRWELQTENATPTALRMVGIDDLQALTDQLRNDSSQVEGSGERVALKTPSPKEQGDG